MRRALLAAAYAACMAIWVACPVGRAAAAESKPRPLDYGKRRLAEIDKVIQRFEISYLDAQHLMKERARVSRSTSPIVIPIDPEVAGIEKKLAADEAAIKRDNLSLSTAATTPELAEAQRRLAADDDVVKRDNLAVGVSSPVAQAPGSKPVASPEISQIERVLAVDDAAVKSDNAAFSAATVSTAALSHQVVSDCLKKFSYEGMLASYGKSWTTAELVTPSENFVADVTMNQLCLEMANGSDDACAGSSALFDAPYSPRQFSADSRPMYGGDSFRTHCRMRDQDMHRVRAIPLGPEKFKEVCSHDKGTAVPLDKFDAFCGIVAAHLGDPAGAARKVGTSLVNWSPQEIAFVTDSFSLVMGFTPPPACKKMTDPFKAAFCLASYDYRQARKSGIAACGSDGLCRALDGGGAPSCAPYEHKVRDAYCHRQFKEIPELLARKKQRFEAAKEQLSKDIKRRDQDYAALKAARGKAGAGVLGPGARSAAAAQLAKDISQRTRDYTILKAASAKAASQTVGGRQLAKDLAQRDHDTQILKSIQARLQQTASRKVPAVPDAAETQYAQAIGARFKELREMLDLAMRMCDSSEPKSMPGLAARREKLDDLNDALNDLFKAQPAPKPKTKDGAPETRKKPASKPS